MYETVDKLISKAALSKFTHYLWYLSEEIAVLLLFDEANKERKANIVANLQRESLYGEKICSIKGSDASIFVR